MISSPHSVLSGRTAMLAAAFAALALAGCAGGSNEALTSIYVDPSRYNLYNCAQLRDAKRAASTRAAEVQGLINKAQSGFAGSVISEVAYRNDYNSARAQYKLADEAWQRNRCDSERLPPEKGVVATGPVREPPPIEQNEQLREQFYRPQPER